MSQRGDWYGGYSYDYRAPPYNNGPTQYSYNNPPPPTAPRTTNPPYPRSPPPGSPYQHHYQEPPSEPQPTPEFRIPGAFDEYLPEVPPVPPKPFPGYGASVEYVPPPPDSYYPLSSEHPGYSHVPARRPESPGPKYVGRTRARSRASSRVSSTAESLPSRSEPDRPAPPVSRRKRQPPVNVQGYKPPTVESAPNSPALLPTLPVNDDAVFKDNPDYVPPPPPAAPESEASGYSSTLSDAPAKVGKPERRPLRSFIVLPDVSSSKSESSAPSSPPPSDDVPLQRERRPYASAGKPKEPSPPPIERKPQPYSYSPRREKDTVKPKADGKPADRLERERHTGYAALGSDLRHSREDTRPPRQLSPVPPSPRRPSPRRHSPAPPRSPAPARKENMDNGLQAPPRSPLPSPRPDAQLVHKPEHPPIPPCTKQSPVTHGFWWKLKGYSNFSVCEDCYEKYIADSKFFDAFEEYDLPKDCSIYCCFNTPRIMNQAWPATINEDSLRPFLDHVSVRSKYPICPQTPGCPPQNEPIAWYTMPLMHDRYQIALNCCGACFEDVVRVSKFSKWFHYNVPLTRSPVSTFCSVGSMPFIKALLLQDCTIDTFMMDAAYRMREMATCPKDERTHNPNIRWWRPKDTDMQLYICDACYCDGIYPTEFKDEFVFVHQTEPKQAWLCCVGAYDLSPVFAHAVNLNNFDIWFDAACEALDSCFKATPHTGENWHVIDVEGFEKFSICDRCAHTYFHPFGFADDLLRKPVDRNNGSWCGFSTHHRPLIVAKLHEAAHWREFELFLEWLEPRIADQPCPGDMQIADKVWWVTEGSGACFCEECYRFQVAHSRFSPLVRRKRREASPRRCDLGTITGQMLWDAALKRLGHPSIRDEADAFNKFVEGLSLQDQLEELREEKYDAARKEIAAKNWKVEQRYKDKVRALGRREELLRDELDKLKM